MSCVSCNSPPAPCNCAPSETCVQTSRNCTSCPLNICIDSPGSSAAPVHHSSGIGAVVGGTVGGVLGALALFALGWLLNRFLSRRSAKKTFTPRAFQFSKSHSPRERSSKGLFNKAFPAAPPSRSRPGVNPSTEPDASPDALHQKQASSSSRRISQAVLNKRNSAHMLDVIDPDVLDLQSHRSGNILGADTGRTPELLIEDDPFSDRNSRKSLNGHLPSIQTHSPLLGSDPALFGLTYRTSDLSSFSPSAANAIPVAYIPPTSKSLSIEDVDDRDGLGNSGPPTATASDCMGPDPAFRRGSSNLISFEPFEHRQRSPHPSPTLASAFQSSFLPHNAAGLTNPPLPSAQNRISKPTRPPRAPGLDLRLPTATSPQSDKSPMPASDPDSRVRPRKSTFGRDVLEPTSAFADSRFSVDSSLPRHSVASLANSSGGRWSQPPPMPIPNSLPFARHHHGSNDGMPPGSRLSLDFSSKHPSFLPDQSRPRSNVSDATTHDSHLSSILDPAMIVTPVTLVRTASGRQAAVQRVALRGQEKARVVRLNRNSSLSTPTHQPPPPNRTSHLTSAAEGNNIARETPDSSSGSLIVSGASHSFRASTLPHSIDEDESVKADSMSTIVAVHTEVPTSRDDSSQSSTETAPRDPFTDSAAIEIIRAPNNNSALPTRRSAVITQGTSEGGSSLRSLTTSADTQDRVTPPSPDTSAATSSTDDILSQHTPSVYSNATTTAADHGHYSRPRLPITTLVGSLPLPRNSMAASSASGHESFADGGAVPDDVSAGSRSIYGHQQHSLNALVAEEFERGLHLQPFRHFAGQDPSARASVVSTTVSVRSGYGSMLEGIPFNIGFNSTGDDGFGGLGDLTGVEEGDEPDVTDDMRAGLRFVEETGGI